MSADPFDRLVALRPEVPDEHDWASSPAADAALRRVHEAGAAKPSWWTRRRFVVPSVVIGLGAAVAGGVAFASAGRDAAAVPVACLDRTSNGEKAIGVTTLPAGTSHAEIVATCNAQYADVGHPAPTDFALCVVPPGRNLVGGAEMAVASKVVVTATNAASICQAAGYEPIR